MHSTHSEMYAFYDKYVRLSRETQNELTRYRDTNLARLETGLTNLGFALPEQTCGQGSYAMSTMVQQPNGDYDIDTAVIFASTDLPSSPLKARQRVLAGIERGGGNFKRPPEARTNAVTVWYQEGQHIDLAVYRRYYDIYGKEVIEHAGSEWCRRDPRDITNWFRDEVAKKSPSPEAGATVKDGQMRRIVQLLKMFAKSSPNWRLPGGLLVSVLVSECYVADWYRDDLSLYNTIVAIHNRLGWNTEVLNPVDPTLKLTYKNEYLCQVQRLEEKLGKVIEWLAPLFEANCDELTAYKAWRKVFDHYYWGELVTGAEMALASKGLYVGTTGLVHISKPSERSVHSPSHRFYGDEETS